MSFRDDCLDDDGERWEVVPELDALERGRPEVQQQRSPGQVIRLCGADRARLEQHRSKQ